MIKISSNINDAIHALENLVSEFSLLIMDLTKPQAKELVVLVTQDILARSIEKTPVLTGQARGGWSAGYKRLKRFKVNNVVAPGIKGFSRELQLGSDSKGKVFENKDIFSKRNRKTGRLEKLDYTGSVKVENTKTYFAIEVENDVPYIHTLEFGTVGAGASKQAPHGMLRVSIMEVRNEFSPQIATFYKRVWNALKKNHSQNFRYKSKKAPPRKSFNRTEFLNSGVRK